MMMYNLLDLSEALVVVVVRMNWYLPKLKHLMLMINQKNPFSIHWMVMEQLENLFSYQIFGILILPVGRPGTGS
jgi:hypothetical protein